MPTLVSYRGLEVVSPDPVQAGGLAIQNDLKSLVLWAPKSLLDQTTSPAGTDDVNSHFYPGSLWQQTNTTPAQLWICTSNGVGAAIWVPLLLKVVQDISPKLGGNLDINGFTMTGALQSDSTPKLSANLDVNGHSIIGATSVTLGVGSNTVSVTAAGFEVESSFLLGTSSVPGSATFNAILGGGATTPVLGPATADIVCVAAVDNVAGDRRLYVQAEAGSPISLGNDRLNFAGTTAALSVGGTDVVTLKSGAAEILGNLLVGIATAPSGATFNSVLGGGATSPVLGAATADVVSLAAVDKTAGDRRLYVQSEAGSAISLGNDRLNFAGTAPSISVGGTDVVSISSGGIGVNTTPGSFVGSFYKAGGTSFLNVETGASGSNGSVRMSNPGRTWVMGVRGDLSNYFAFADSTAGAIRFVLDSSGNLLVGGATTSPTSAAFNLALGGSSTVLGAATTDTVCLAAVDNGAGNRELQVQPESGGYLAWGNNKLRLVPTSNQDTYRWLPTVNTTDATQTTLATIPITASSTYLIEARIVARRTGGSAGTADDGAVYVRRATYTTKSGTVTLMGSVQTIGTDTEDQAGWDATLDINSTNVRVRVTGATNNNVTWMGDVSVQRVNS